MSGSDSIMGIGMTRPPREEPEVEQKIKIEEPEWNRFKKDDELRAKTRQSNIERDDKLAREEENLAREKIISQEKKLISQEKKISSQETLHPQGRRKSRRHSQPALNLQGKRKSFKTLWLVLH